MMNKINTAASSRIGGGATALQNDGSVQRASNVKWENVPPRTINVNDVPFSLWQLGPDSGVPVIFHGLSRLRARRRLSAP